MLITLCLWPRRGRNRTGSRTVPKPYLTDEQWLLIADLFFNQPARKKFIKSVASEFSHISRVMQQAALACGLGAIHA